jgi:hypothetical protein
MLRFHWKFSNRVPQKSTKAAYRGREPRCTGEFDRLRNLLCVIYENLLGNCIGLNCTASSRRFLTLFLRAANIEFWPLRPYFPGWLVFLESSIVGGNRRSTRPRRLARPRTSPFHGGNTGSNPVGDAKHFQSVTRISSDVRGTTTVQVPVGRIMP